MRRTLSIWLVIITAVPVAAHARLPAGRTQIQGRVSVTTVPCPPGARCAAAPLVKIGETDHLI